MRAKRLLLLSSLVAAACHEGEHHEVPAEACEIVDPWTLVFQGGLHPESTHPDTPTHATHPFVTPLPGGGRAGLAWIDGWGDPGDDLVYYADFGSEGQLLHQPSVVPAFAALDTVRSTETPSELGLLIGSTDWQLPCEGCVGKLIRLRVSALGLTPVQELDLAFSSFELDHVLDVAWRAGQYFVLARGADLSLHLAQVDPIDGVVSEHLVRAPGEAYQGEVIRVDDALVVLSSPPAGPSASLHLDVFPGDLEGPRHEAVVPGNAGMDLCGRCIVADAGSLLVVSAAVEKLVPTPIVSRWSMEGEALDGPVSFDEPGHVPIQVLTMDDGVLVVTLGLSAGSRHLRRLGHDLQPMDGRGGPLQLSERGYVRIADTGAQVLAFRTGADDTGGDNFDPTPSVEVTRLACPE